MLLTKKHSKRELELASKLLAKKLEVLKQVHAMLTASKDVKELWSEAS